MQDKIPTGGLKYRVQWKLLVPATTPTLNIPSSLIINRLRRQYESPNLEPISPERAAELGIPVEYTGGEENVTQLTWDSPTGKLCKGTFFQIELQKNYDLT